VRTLTAAVIAVIAVGAAACGGPAGSARPIRIAIGGQTQLIYLPTTLASELGFYKDEGVDVELQDHAGGSKALEALLGGSADVVSGFYDHTIQMAADGRSLVAFVTMLRYPGLVLTTSPQRAAALTSIDKLAGTTAGVTAVGSSSNMLLTYLLERNGLKPDAVSVTGIGTAATAVAAVERGRVDAGMMADPAFTIMQRRNVAVRVLADLRTGAGVKAAMGTDAYPGSVLYATRDWVMANRDAAGRLARAITRTLEWMQTHSAAEIAAKMPASFRGDDPELYTQALDNSRSMYSPDGRMTREGAAAVRAVLADSIEKVRRADVDLSKTYTNEYLGH